MSRFTSLEKRLANSLNSKPRLKAVLKRVYIVIMRLSKITLSRYKTDFNVETVHNFNESFFGYYDKNPSNGDGLLIFHESEFDTSKDPRKVKYINVVLQDEKTKRILWSTRSRAFNWQQGSRLQWLTKKKFIFNDFDLEKNAYVAKIVSTENLLVSEYDMPVQDSFREDFFISINYSRLSSLRPDYGYHSMKKLSLKELNNYSNDGVWRVDIGTKKCDLVVSYDEIFSISPKKEFQYAFHKINHVQISPGGGKLIFLHRYFLKRRRIDRLILLDFSNLKMNLLTDGDFVSHYCWLDDSSLVIYMNDKTSEDAFYHLNTVTGSKKIIKGFSEFGDGHPTGSQSSCVVDTYPNRSGMQSLFLLDNVHSNRSPKLIGEFYHPLKFSSQSRCDLHPRYNSLGKCIYIDSVYNGKRQLCKINLS